MPVVLLAQDEGPRDVAIPNPMSAHTWFIIAAVGAFLAWCISYVLQMQREKLERRPQDTTRKNLLRQKESLLERLAELESEKDGGKITTTRYDQEFRKARGRLSHVLDRLRRNSSAEA